MTESTIAVTTWVDFSRSVLDLLFDLAGGVLAHMAMRTCP